MDFDFNRPHRLTYRQLGAAWPRRLLHIPSMKSVEKTGTYTYRKTDAPSYAIITYTWGRFKAPAGFPALPVTETTWEIPPVKDTCFSVTSFQNAIKRIGEHYEWLWLDVACIDQENESIKMSEVARQVGIFHGAAESYAWLHSLDLLEATDNIAVLAKLNSYDPLGKDHVWDYASEEHRLQLSFQLYRGQLDIIQSSLKFLFTDPWFTSLWTLQESILRRDAQLLSSSGEPIPYRDEEAGSQIRACTVASLNSWCAMIWQDLHYYTVEKKFTEVEQVKATAVMTLIEKVGFNFTSAVNPNVQYGAARFRETEYPLDRIYGIFGIYRTVIPDTYQLPVPSAINIDGLELAFASALNEASPWLAQCFVHLVQPVPRRSWCITQNSTVPPQFQDFNSKWPMTVESRFIPEISGHATVQGRACPLKALWAYWIQMQQIGLVFGGTKFPYRFAIAYDVSVSTMLAWSHSQQVLSPIMERIDKSSQDPQDEFKATRRLINSYASQDLYVLHMARENGRSNSHHDRQECHTLSPRIWCTTTGSQTLSPKNKFDTLFDERDMTWGLQWEMASTWDGDLKAFGVILIRDSAGVWKRIGICTWTELYHTEHSLRDWACRVH